MLTPALQQLLRQGTAHHQHGRYGEAAALFARVRQLAPRDAAGWHHGGLTALAVGQAAEAVPLLERAWQLSPNSVASAFGLGVARVATGDQTGAEAVLQQIVKTQPAMAEAWHYLALVFKTSGRLAEAIAAQRKVVALKPAYAAGWHALGSSLGAHGSPTEALACFERALKLEPDNLRTQLGRGMMLFKCFRVEEAEAAMGAIVARDPQQIEARSYRLMALNSLEQRPREAVFAEHVAFGRTLPKFRPPGSVTVPDPARRLRIAFLSPDLREHSVAYFLEPMLQHLDRGAFEIFLYHDHAIVDAVSARLRSLAAGWRHFAGQADGVVEKAIREDAPDVLIDLAGHTGLNRLPLFARRLAPVQVTYLGYPNTTGLREMDYRFVDACTDPAPEAETLHTEKLVRFSPTAWSYLAPAHAPEPAPPPSLVARHVTFGSFNNLTKATDGTMRRWARVLDAVPGSRLLIKSGGLDEPAVRDPLLRRLAAAGLGGRVELLPHARDTASHLDLYGRVDVALDTFPYHGTTTTCEALWMGVPVVTLAGDRHVSRVGVSLLAALGHREWIAAQEDDYVRIAAALAQDTERRTALRRSLRDEMRLSLLCDHAGQARRFGMALRECWQQWCAGAAEKERLAS